MSDVRYTCLYGYMFEALTSDSYAAYCTDSATWIVSIVASTGCRCE